MIWFTLSPDNRTTASFLGENTNPLGIALQTGVEPPLYFTVPQLPILRSQILRSGGCLNILNHQAFPSVDFLFFFYNTGTFLDAMLLHLAQIIRVTQGA